MLRAPLPLTAIGLAALALAGCTSNTQVCKNGTCEIDLSGKGAVVVLGGEGGSEMELISASGKTAKVRIGNTTGELTVGDPVNLDNATLTLTEVEGEDDIQATLETGVGTKTGTTPSGATGDTPGNAPN